MAGYSEEAPGSQEEEELLTQLANACLGSSDAENEELLLDVMALARAQGQFIIATFASNVSRIQMARLCDAGGAGVNRR